MERSEFDRRRVGPVKAAITSYGERILEGDPALKNNSQKNFPELAFGDRKRTSSGQKDLLLAKRDITRYKDSRRNAQSTKIEAENELFSAKNTVKNLRMMIEQSNSSAKLQAHDSQKLARLRPSLVRRGERHNYEAVVRELEAVKQELSRLKLSMASVLEEKSQAEKEAAASRLKVSSYSTSVKALQKEIEEIGEEQVLVELAQIEALKEHGAIEAQREKEASQYSAKTEEATKKINVVREEIENSKEMEDKLAMTLADVDVLQNELRLVRAMDKKGPPNNGYQHPEGGFDSRKEAEASVLLRSVTAELEDAKKELAAVKEESFQFMASMDTIRNELKFVSEEKARLKKEEVKTESVVQNLNSKLLRAKSKLETVTAAEDKARSIVSNLSLTLEQLKTEAEAAKKEKQLITQETEAFKEEIHKTERETHVAEERLQAAMQELEAVKALEALALENLRTLSKNTMKQRASTSQHASSIAISKFEYDYLIGHATGAKAVADKKVAAAQAWVEAIKASEREILMKSEAAHGVVKETRIEEEQQVYRTERSLSAKRRVEGEMTNWKQRGDKQTAFPRKSPRKLTGENSPFSPATRAKLRKSTSPGTRQMARPTSISLKKKRVMPNLSKFFTGGDMKRNTKTRTEEF